METNEVGKYYIGIDPGAKGGIAVIDESGKAAVYPYSEETLVCTMQYVVFSYSVCCLEKVHAMPGQGVTSMFTFGSNYGFIRGVLKANHVPFQEVPPQKWKKEFSLNDDKARSIEVAHQLFPNVSLRRTERCTTDHDGMAEALLMAEYARRKL